MSVKSILKVKGDRVVTVDATDSVRDVVATLARERIGAVVVREENREVGGILSERDIMVALAKHGAGLLDIPAGDIMTRAITVATIDMQLDQVLEIMTQGRFRHMPVVEGGRLVGLVSIGDAVKARLDSLERETLELKEYIGGR